MTAAYRPICCWSTPTSCLLLRCEVGVYAVLRLHNAQEEEEGASGASGPLPAVTDQGR